MLMRSHDWTNFIYTNFILISYIPLLSVVQMFLKSNILISMKLRVCIIVYKIAQIIDASSFLSSNPFNAREILLLINKSFKCSTPILYLLNYFLIRSYN